MRLIEVFGEKISPGRWPRLNADLGGVKEIFVGKKPVLGWSESICRKEFISTNVGVGLVVLLLVVVFEELGPLEFGFCTGVVLLVLVF